MIELIRENIGWVKDIFTLLFAFTAIVIAILTYRRARHSIFQPIRSEVIKNQADLLTNLLSSCQPISKFNTRIDYTSIAQLNTIYNLKDLGFIFKDQEKINSLIEKSIVAWMPCGESNILRDVEVVGSFTDNNSSAEDESVKGKEQYEQAKLGSINIDYIGLTTEHTQFTQELRELKDNPFMPSTLRDILEKLLTEINQNLCIILKNHLQEFLVDFFDKSNLGNGYPKSDMTGVYNEFNHKRVHHNELITELFNETRNHLRIDEQW
jgi:hypothetical protein